MCNRPESLPMLLARLSSTITGPLMDQPLLASGHRVPIGKASIKWQASQANSRTGGQGSRARIPDRRPSRNASREQMIRKIKDLSNVSTVIVGPEGDYQRVDNYLLRQCKGVPRSHVYRILRTGEVRVNSRRVDSTHRLREGDRVRIPPIRLSENGAAE